MLCASVSSKGANKKPPNASPPNVDFFKKFRRLFSSFWLSFFSSGFSCKPIFDKNFSDGVIVKKFWYYKKNFLLTSFGFITHRLLCHSLHRSEFYLTSQKRKVKSQRF